MITKGIKVMILYLVLMILLLKEVTLNCDSDKNTAL